MLNLDNTIENADWAKGPWDPPFDLGNLDSEQARAFLSAAGLTKEQFMRLPVYQRWERQQKEGRHG